MPSFPIPEGFEIPEGLKEGDTFEAMAELQVESDGKVSIVSLEGCECEDEMDGEDDESEDEYGKGKGGFVNQIELKFGTAGLD